MSDTWCPECEVTFRGESCPSCGFKAPEPGDYLQQLVDSAVKIARALGAKKLTQEEVLKNQYTSEVQRLHRIAEAMGVMNYWDEAVRMEAEIRKAMCQPLFLAVCHDRHCDDWYALFRDPEKGKEWIREQLEKIVPVDEVREGIRGVDFFAREDEWVCAFHTDEDGPSGHLEAIPSPKVQEGGD